MLSIAALLSKGEPLPFTETEENEPMTIIYQTTEDDADDTVVPRFNSADGNGENLIFIKEDEKTLSFGDIGKVALGDGDRGFFDLACPYRLNAAAHRRQREYADPVKQAPQPERRHLICVPVP